MRVRSKLRVFKAAERDKDICSEWPIWYLLEHEAFTTSV